MKNKFDRNFLLDSWNAHGKDLDEFRGMCQDIADATHYRKASTAEFALILRGYENEKEFKFCKWDTYAIKELEKNGVGAADFKDFPVKKKHMDDVLFRETMNGAGFLISENRHTYYVSENALSSLFSRANMAGDSAFINSNARNYFLAECLWRAGIGIRSNGKHDYKKLSNPDDQNCTLVTREVNVIGDDGEEKNLRKIFFVPTEKYAPVPLTVLADVAEEICDDDILGRPEVRYWYFNHGIAEICIVFPEKAEEIKTVYKLKDDILPGVLLRTSDTGECCVDIKSIAFVGKHSHRYVALETYKRKHSGEMDIEEVIENADHLLLRNIKKLPELLADLIGRYVYEGDTSDANWASKNKAAVEKAIKKVFKYIRLVPVLGKKREKSLKEQLFAEINPEVPYTEYDIAIMVMTISDRVEGLSQTKRDELANACATAPFAFERKKEEDDTDEIVLVPED